MEDKEICFPLNSIGYWHNGVHVINEESVIQKYLAFVCAIRNSEFLLDKSNGLYEIITDSEYKLLSDEEKKLYSDSSGNTYYKLKDSRIDSVIKQILKKLSLYSSQDFVLFQHTYYNDKNLEKFEFFSLYMHLDKVLNAKSLKNIEYSNANTLKVLFPNTTFAKAGASEKDGIIYQVEYFMDKKNVDDFFKNKQLFILGNECHKIDGEVQLFSLNSQNEIIKRSYLRNTIFEIKEFPNEEKYPNIAKIKPYLLPCIIYKDNNSFQLQKSSDLNFKLNLKALIQIKLLELNSKAKIQYLLNNGFINESQVEFIEKFHNLKIESINDILYQKEIKLRDLICGFDFRELLEFKICFINNHALKFDDNEFYVDLNSSSLKEVYFDKRRMFLLLEDKNLETIKYNPCLYEAVSKNKIISDKSLIIPCNKIYFNNDNIKYDLNEKPYCRYSDNLYYCLDTKKDIFISPNDYFTFVSYDDLKTVEEESDLQTKKEKLRKIFDEKTKIENKNYIEGAFEHPSEWHKDDSAYNGLGFKQKYIKKNLAIWDNNYFNKSLPNEIRDCHQFTFFYKTQFETFLTNLHHSYADKLIKVQDIIMHKYSYKQGNLGLYKDQFGFKSSDEQTFCNHAVFETIIKVDGNFYNFTNKTANRKNISRKPSEETFPECPKTKEYAYTASNYWCDVLEEQCKKFSKTGICKITAEQAFYMAQLGYVVIACWKNNLKKNEKPSENHSPHFVTIRPAENEYQGIGLLQVAHVGAGLNKELKLLDAFDTAINDSKLSEIKYYCNVKQSFI